MSVSGTGGEHPGQLELLHIVRLDLIEFAITPARILSTDLKPVGGLRILEALGSNGLVIPQNCGHWGGNGRSRG